MQYLKDDIQERILAAALEVFARKGFRDTTMADIGRVARISTGNLYRYFENKEVLFHVAVPEGFAKRFLGLMRRKVESLAGVEDVRSLDAGSSYHLLSEQLLTFCVENRLRIVILLGKAHGTRYEGFADEVVHMLSELAIVHFRGFRFDLRMTEIMRFNLEQIYRNSVVAIVGILERFDQESAIHQAVKGYSQYHLAGLKGFFE